ncbi:MAG: hypothetical protein M1820_004174 [Bogoriella megaspora]|nr:MAG: hypothetical protein M1820_004174 [Bogoriella megaspora]
MYHMYAGDIEVAERELHAKYGPVVRVAHNEVSASEASAIPKIYPTQRPLTKTDFYPTYRPIGISNKADTFTETDEVAHAKHRKIVNPVYSMTSILKNESAMDGRLTWLVKRLGEFADRKEVVDLGHWLEMQLSLRYAYEIVGVVFFGEPFGFLDRGFDHLNYVEAVWKGLPLLGFAAVSPTYMRNLIMFAAILNPSTFRAVKHISGITDAALKNTARRREDSEKENLQRNDLLSQLFRVERERGEQIDFTHKEIALESWAGVIAGADSTTIAMRSVLYNLMKHPGHLAKVLEEIDAADAVGLLSSPIKHSEVITLKYTCAAIKEAMRIFPPWQIHMPRHTPPEGLEISGKYIAGGYRVGANPALVHFDKEVFGPDANDFKPERWLESDQRSFAMDKAILGFGAGTRTCIGKNLALAEVHKTVSELLRHYTFEMSHDRPWKTRNSAFIMQYDITVHVRHRHRDSK